MSLTSYSRRHVSYVVAPPVQVNALVVDVVAPEKFGRGRLLQLLGDNVVNLYLGGGLGIRSILTLKEASNLKNYWDLFNSND